MIEYVSAYYSANGTLNVPNGTLTNSPTGTIHTIAGGSYSNYILAQLDNQGTINIDKALIIDKASANHTNSGNITLGDGDLTLTQTGANPSFTNNGTFTVDSVRILTINSGAFNHTSGTFNLYGSLTATNATINIVPSYNHMTTMTLTNTDLMCSALFTNQGDLTISNGSIGGSGSFQNDSSMMMTTIVIDVPYENYGFTRITNTCDFNDTLITHPNTTIQLHSQFQWGGYLTVPGDLVNHGLIEYVSDYYSANGTLNVPNGTLINSPAGTIHTTLGGTYSNYILAQLDNQGSITVDKALIIDKASATHVNSGTIVLGDGDLTLTQSGTNPSFMNTGIFSVDSARTLTVTNGTFNYTSGSFNLNGSLTATNATINFVPAFTHTTAITLTNSDLICSALFINQGDITISNGTIGGSGSFQNDSTMIMTTMVIDLPYENYGLTRLTDDGYFNNTLTTHLNSTIQLYSQFQSGGDLFTANTLTNNGLIEFVSAYYSSNGSIEVSNGSLINAQGGTIHTVAGGSYTNNINAHLYNQGTIIVDKSLHVNEASAAHISNGTITVNSNALTFTGSSFTNQSTGLINGSGTMDVSNVTFSNTGMISPGTSAGALNITGDLPQDTSSVINIELGGTVAGSSYDQLNVSGQAILDGTLNISLIDNFIPVIGDTFDILTFNSKSDTFMTVNGLFTGTGILFDLISNSTSMKLVTTGAPNHPPIIINPISDQFLDEDFDSYWVAHLDSVFDDSDIFLGDSLTYGFSISNNLINGYILGGELFLNSVSDSNGFSSIIVTATDIGLSSVSDTFLVTIVPVNDPPSAFQLLEPADQIVLSSIDTIDFIWKSSFDVDNDQLQYELRMFDSSWDTTFSNLADTTFEFLTGNRLQLSTIYQWTVSVFDGFVSVASPDTFSFTTPEPNGLSDLDKFIPKVFALRQNYPNPFNPETTISFDLPKAEKVTLRVFDILGREVLALVDEQMPAGSHNVTLNASTLSSGIYLYRIQAGNYIRTRRMVLLK